MSDKLQFVGAFGSRRVVEASDKLKFVGHFGSRRVVEASDKLKFVGHFDYPFALLPSLPAVSSLPACFGQPVIAGSPAGKDGRRSQDVRLNSFDAAFRE